MTAHRSLALVLVAGVSLSACASMKPTLSNRLPPQAGAQTPGTLPSGQGGVYKVGKPYQVGGVWYVPREDPAYDATGIASWYGNEFHQKTTANGELFDMNAVSAAHTTLPMPSMVEVTNLDNGRRLIVRVNDRGPFVGGRLIDLSREAARQLGYEQKGTANVRVRYVGPAPLGVGEGVRYAANTTSLPGPYTVPAPRAPMAVASSLPIAAQPLAPAAAVSAQPLAPAAPAARTYAAAPAYGPGPTYLPQPAYLPQAGYAPPPAYMPTSAAGYTAPAARTYPPVAYAPSYPAAPPATPAAAPRPALGSGLYKVQAAAFSDPGSAQRVARELAAAGEARVELGERDGATIYRVMLQASADESEAWALRDRVATYGYSDARVIRPF